VIFPFINQMVEELGITDNPDRVGFYSGLIVSEHLAIGADETGSGIFFRPILYRLSLGEAIGVSVTGPSAPLRHADHVSKIGRKPVIFTGLTGVAISGSLL
jgi:hypothetical protein